MSTCLFVLHHTSLHFSLWTKCMAMLCDYSLSTDLCVLLSPCWPRTLCLGKSRKEDHCLGTRPASFVGVPGKEASYAQAWTQSYVSRALHNAKTQSFLRQWPSCQVGVLGCGIIVHTYVSSSVSSFRPTSIFSFSICPSLLVQLTICFVYQCILWCLLAQALLCCMLVEWVLRFL